MATQPSNPNVDTWPELPLAAWQDTYATLHMWTQIVGKVRLALTPLINHWWEVPLYVNARGLTTSSIPYDGRIFEVQFDFIEHRLIIQTSWGPSKTLALKAAIGCRFLCGIHVCVAGARDCGENLDDAGPKCRTRCASRAIRSMRPMVRNMQTASGGYWFRARTSFRNSARASSGKTVRCISSGEASIFV